jgi:hypothetical protein
MSSLHRLLVALAAVAALAAASTVAGAHSSGTSWTRISGPQETGIELGLARTPDGVLHVIWNRNKTPTSIFETRFSPAGKAAGTSTVATGWDGHQGLALLVMPDKTLRLFASGATHAGSTADGINTFTAPAGGGKWTLQSGAYWGGAVASAASIISATLTKDGQAVTAWSGTAGEGIPPSSIPQNGYVADQLASHVATDAASGAVVLSGVTIAGKGGVFAQEILPKLGPRVLLPLPFGFNDWYTNMTARVGASGVYAAYTDTKVVRLYRYGGATKTVARGPFTSAGICAGPAGRLWIAWGNQVDGVFVTRSNRAATAFEPVQKLTGPQNTTEALSFIQCEGSAGPLDLFARVNAGGTPGFWQTHVLALFQLRAAVARTKAGSRATLTLRDAGDPVAGVVVAVGGKRLTTDAKGRVSLALRPGSYSATASAAGYAPASVRFSVGSG